MPSPSVRRTRIQTMSTSTATWITDTSTTIMVRLLFTSVFPPARHHRGRRQRMLLDAAGGRRGRRLDAGPPGRLVELGEPLVQLHELAEAHPELGHDRGRHVQRLLAQGAALLRQVDAELALVVRVAGPGDQAGRLEALQHRRE